VGKINIIDNKKCNMIQVETMTPDNMYVMVHGTGAFICVWQNCKAAPALPGANVKPFFFFL
jgi:hypothetical protein